MTFVRLAINIILRKYVLLDIKTEYLNKATKMVKTKKLQNGGKTISQQYYWIRVLYQLKLYWKRIILVI